MLNKGQYNVMHTCRSYYVFYILKVLQVSLLEMQYNS